MVNKKPDDPPPCPHCTSENTALVARTVRLQIFLCFHCARRFEVTLPQSQTASV
jgi:transposase-like protein